jgi:hypothetical protein
VNLVSPERVEPFESHLKEAYRREYGIEPQVYRCIPAAGAGEVAA